MTISPALSTHLQYSARPIIYKCIIQNKQFGIRPNKNMWFCKALKKKFSRHLSTNLINILTRPDQLQKFNLTNSWNYSDFSWMTDILCSKVTTKVTTNCCNNWKTDKVRNGPTKGTFHLSHEKCQWSRSWYQIVDKYQIKSYLNKMCYETQMPMVQN